MMPDLYTIVPLAAICVCTAAAILLIDGMPEFDDRLIFFTEVALAVALGVIVFRYSQKNDRSVQSHLAKVWSMLERSEKAKQAKKSRASRALCSTMSAIRSDCLTLVKAGDRSSETRDEQWRQFKDSLVSLDIRIKTSVDKLRHDLGGADYIDDYTYDGIVEAVDQLGDTIHLDEADRTVDTSRYQCAADMLGPILLRLERHLDPASHPAPVRLPATAAVGSSGPLEIKLDHSVYPPNTTIRASVASDGPFPDKKIYVSILDENFSTLDKKTKNAPVPARDQSDSNIVMVDVRPKDMAVGREYIARAVCGGLAAETVFAVDKIPPEIETDKSIYLMDSDIIVTVIDPSVDTGGTRDGRVRRTKKSSLVIESPHGKIDGYQLEETEVSSGTFQGTIKCIGVRNDGSVRRTQLGDTYVDKAQGKGPEDGVIPCGPNQLIHIRYANEYGTSTASVIVGGFGTVVNLDRDEYTCLDPVEICVISPDLVLDGGNAKPATIGDDRRDCWLTVSTGEDLLEGYRLVEAGDGNGIFIGTVSLTGIAGMTPKKNSTVLAYGRTGGSGPHDGTLACGPHDEIKVHCASAFGKDVIKAAPVRWHIGEIRFSKSSYLPGEEIVVRVTDRDMSLSADRPDMSQVRAWSDSDRAGITVPIQEMGCDSGIFEGQFVTSDDRSLPEQLVLKARDSDIVVAEYVDETPPHPYACNDSVGITSTATITTKRKRPSPLARLVVDDMRIMGKKTRGALIAGDGVEVMIKVKNPEREIRFTAIFQVSNLEGVTIEVQHQPLTARLNGYATHTFSWTPCFPGTCVVEVFLWKSLDDPIAYSPPASRKVQVLDPQKCDCLLECEDGQMVAGTGNVSIESASDGQENRQVDTSHGPEQGGRGR